MKNRLQITVYANSRLTISAKGIAYSFCVKHGPHAIAWGIRRVLESFIPDIDIRYDIPHPLRQKNKVSKMKKFFLLLCRKQIVKCFHCPKEHIIPRPKLGTTWVCPYCGSSYKYVKFVKGGIG